MVLAGVKVSGEAGGQVAAKNVRGDGVIIVSELGSEAWRRRGSSRWKSKGLIKGGVEGGAGARWSGGRALKGIILLPSLVASKLQNSTLGITRRTENDITSNRKRKGGIEGWRITSWDAFRHTIGSQEAQDQYLSSENL
ncbi:uncharacterized protein A4U43_C04F25300 [Asparagus officinalis]|uniref:Uncharacterized protein n=1 Tax=Asparagus officinalis TaxID=4686 RepID=A0A5P1F5C0_ASPOF|nr:uncharacterized protein A4U43_C04F25300 [Asparagus officinalis]